MAHIDGRAVITVSIPTYNRPEQLERTLSLLLPQLDETCFLRIIDNHSDVLVTNYATPLIKNYGSVKYEIIRNRVNIGAEANVMRCFELCETEWLWILGDDDLIEEHAIAIIADDIKQNPNVVNINYYSPNIYHPERIEPRVAAGRTQFLEYIDNFGASIFLSTNVYNISSLLDKLPAAYYNTYSCAPQWILVYLSLGNSDITIYSNKVVCLNGFHSGEETSKYTKVNLYAIKGFSTFLDIPMKKSERLILIKKLSTCTKQWFTLDGIIKNLLIENERQRLTSHDTFDIKFLFSRYYYSFYKHTSKFIFVKYFLYSFLLTISPKLTFRFVRKLYFFKKGTDINQFVSGNCS